jgi:hypothetical protein
MGKVEPSSTFRRVLSGKIFCMTLAFIHRKKRAFLLWASAALAAIGLLAALIFAALKVPRYARMPSEEIASAPMEKSVEEAMRAAEKRAAVAEEARRAAEEKAVEARRAAVERAAAVRFAEDRAAVAVEARRAAEEKAVEARRAAEERVAAAGEARSAAEKRAAAAEEAMRAAEERAAAAEEARRAAEKRAAADEEAIRAAAEKAAAAEEALKAGAGREKSATASSPWILVDQALDKLLSASLAFNAPDRARLGKELVIQAKLSTLLGESELKSLIQSEMERQRVESGRVETTTLKISDQVEATLYGGTAFDVAPSGPQRQWISGKEPTSWIWKITPKVAGLQTLILSFEPVILINGRESKRHLSPIIKRIEVEVGWPETFGEWLDLIRKYGENLWWIWATLLIPIGGGIWAWWKRRRPSKPN